MEVKFKFTPGQVLALKVVGALAVGVLSAVVNQKIGARRGYRQGWAEGHSAGFDEGMSPLKQAELDQAHIEGWRMGCSDGVRYSKPTIVSEMPDRNPFSDGMHFELGRQLMA